MAIWGTLIGGVLGLMNDGGGGNTQITQNTVPPEFSGLASMVGQYGQGFADLPYQPYPYAQVADFNPYQYMGFDMAANRALGGSALPQQAEQTLQNTLGGGYMQPTGFNPYANAFSSPGSNQYIGSQSSPGSNPYAGQNPYLESVIGNTLGDVTKQFNTTVAPSMATTAMKSGSFGNTGYQEAEQMQRDALAKQLGNISSGMRMQDYGMQQGLAESDINRRLAAQQQDLARNAGLVESGLGRNLGAQQQDLSRNASLYEQMFGRQQNAYDAERNRMMGALGMSPTIYGLGYAPAQQLQGIGSTMQQQAQNVLGSQYGQFQEAQNWPFKIYDTMRAPFGGINPGGSQTVTGPQGSPAAGLLGGAMLGGRLGGIFGGQGGQSGLGATWGTTPYTDPWYMGG